jgi:hypothetical protein
LIALESPARGLPYLVLGLTAFLAATFFIFRFSALLGALDDLTIDARWALVPALAVLVLIGTYELLRLAAFFEEAPSTLRTPRILAVFLLPSGTVLIGGWFLVAAWPQVVEATWTAALVLFVGGLLGTLWCTCDGLLLSRRRRVAFRIAGVLLIVLAGLSATVTGAFSDGARRSIALKAREAGFRVVPNLFE